MDTKALRQKILDLAIHGKLVPQDPNDEPASVLLERIKAEKERLIKEGKIKRSKKSAKTSDTPHYENVPFKVPEVWVWTTLGEILELVSGQDFPPEKYNANIAGIPYIIGASNIENEQLIINRWTESPSVYSYLNDLLVVCKGAGVGKMAINNIGVAHIARQIQAVRGYTNYTDIKYIKAVVKNNIENIISKANGLIPGLKREFLLSLQLPLPPISEQRRIVCEIERWFFLIDQIEQGKADLQTVIKQAKSKILDLAIHGKLVPQDPNDEPAIELLKRINPDFTPCDNGHYTQLPEGWAICKMKQITSITNGKSQKNVETLNGIYPIYGSGGVIGRANQYLCIAGSTIIGRKGTINNPIFVEEHFWNVDTAFGLKANDAILDKYLYYFCLSFDFSKLDKSTAMPSLTKTSIGNVLIPIPPYKEQERIVAKIDMVLDTMNEILRAV